MENGSFQLPPDITTIVDLAKRIVKTNYFPWSLSF